MSKDKTPTTDARIVSKLPEGDYSPQVNLLPSQLHTFPEEISIPALPVDLGHLPRQVPTLFLCLTLDCPCSTCVPLWPTDHEQGTGRQGL